VGTTAVDLVQQNNKMSKRGNDLSQLSKEEYEAAMAGGDSSSGSGAFAKASTEVLGRRKILRTGG
jgi:hypothetical protein